MVLVDTSVWIEFFRRPSRIDLSAVIDFDDVVTCLPVLQEVLQGFQDQAAFALARDAMLALPMVESPLGQDVVEEAVQLFRRARAAGITVRSSVDCLIAACALRHRLTVLHRDRDFAQLARVSPLAAWRRPAEIRGLRQDRSQGARPSAPEIPALRSLALLSSRHEWPAAQRRPVQSLHSALRDRHGNPGSATR